MKHLLITILFLTACAAESIDKAKADKLQKLHFDLLEAQNKALALPVLYQKQQKEADDAASAVKASLDAAIEDIRKEDKVPKACQIERTKEGTYRWFEMKDGKPVPCK